MERSASPRRMMRALVLAGAMASAVLATSVRAEKQAAPGETEFKPQSTFYAELLGSGIAYSLNYDYRAARNLALRAGGEGWGGTGGVVAIFPVTVSGLLGTGKNNFEFGGGPVFIFGTGDLHDFGTTVIGSAFVAYRMQPAEGGFFFRAGIGPLFNSNAFLIWPVLAFGVSF